MASTTERTVINAAGLVQGIVLVTFPAASTIFTSTSEYGLSSSQYGAMFLPQVALAITTSLLGAGLARRISTKRVYLLGLACSTVAMALLLASTLVKSNQAAAYPLLLVATAFLGAGFGLTVPVLNTYTSVFNPDSVDRSVLVLNALLGLGTALAPVLVAIFVGLGFWWGLPIVSTVLLVGLLVVSVRLPLQAGAQAGAARRAGTFLLTSVLSRPHAAAGIAVFALAGLGCSALLPLTISFGSEDLTAMAAAMAGGVIAFYQLGYGIAAFGVGPLTDSGVSLSAIFGFTAVVAGLMALLSFFVTRRPARAAMTGPGSSLPVSAPR